MTKHVCPDPSKGRAEAGRVRGDGRIAINALQSAVSGQDVREGKLLHAAGTEFFSRGKPGQAAFSAHRRFGSWATPRLAGPRQARSRHLPSVRRRLSAAVCQPVVRALSCPPVGSTRGSRRREGSRNSWSSPRIGVLPPVSSGAARPGEDADRWGTEKVGSEATDGSGVKDHELAESVVGCSCPPKLGAAFGERRGTERMPDSQNPVRQGGAEGPRSVAGYWAALSSGGEAQTGSAPVRVFDRAGDVPRIRHGS